VSYILTPSNNSSQGNQVINIGTNQLVSQTSTSTPAVQKSLASKPATSIVNVRNIVNQTTVKPGPLVTKPVPQFGGSPQFGTTQFLLQGVTQIHPMPTKHFQVDSKMPLFQSIVSKTPSQALLNYLKGSVCRTHSFERELVSHLQHLQSWFEPLFEVEN
jgi:hypothetical protein